MPKLLNFVAILLIVVGLVFLAVIDTRRGAYMLLVGAMVAGIAHWMRKGQHVQGDSEDQRRLG